MNETTSLYNFNLFVYLYIGHGHDANCSMHSSYSSRSMDRHEHGYTVKRKRIDIQMRRFYRRTSATIYYMILHKMQVDVPSRASHGMSNGLDDSLCTLYPFFVEFSCTEWLFWIARIAKYTKKVHTQTSRWNWFKFRIVGGGSEFVFLLCSIRKLNERIFQTL